MTWETVPLATLVPDVAVGFASSDDLEDGIFQIRMNNLTRASAWDWSRRRRVSPTARQLQSATVRAGDVIFNATNSPALVGKSGLMPALDEPAVISNHFMRLRPIDTLDRGYLAHWLRAEFERGVFRARAKAWINQATVGRDTLLAMKIPLPPLAEQRRIGAILDEANRLRQRTITQAGLLSSQFEAAFTQLMQTDSQPATIGDLLISTQYGTSSKAGGDGGFPILRMGNITADGHVDLGDLKYVDLDPADYHRYLVREGDLLFNRTNSAELVGKTAIYRESEPRAFAGYLVRARPRTPLLGELIAGYLNSRSGKRELRRMAKSIVGMANINATEFRSMRIMVPDEPALARYSAQVEHILANRQRLSERAAHLDTLFASLQHRAFRGEL